MNEDHVCQCFVCRHRGETELIKAYYEGFIEASKQILDWAKRNHIEPGSIADDDLPGIIAQIQCNMDETKILLDELKQNKEETITITKSEYDELTNDSKMLGCLDACGVDNWEGYDIALEYLEDMENKAK